MITLDTKTIESAIHVLGMFGISVTSDSLIPMRSFSNFVWKVRSSEKYFVLRRYLHLNLDAVLCLNRNLLFLRNSGFHIPLIMENENGKIATEFQGQVYDLSEYIQHKPFSYKNINIGLNQITIAGTILSNIHSFNIGELPCKVMNKYQEEVNPNHIFKLVNDFQNSFEDIYNQANEENKKKIIILGELIRLTDDRRFEVAEAIKDKLETLPLVLTHGDYSLSNLLPETDERLTIIDWENMGLRPRIWEFHRALLLICGKGYCNANFDEIDFQKAEMFISSYQELSSFDTKELEYLPYVAEYVAFVHWLRFTLESVLKGDTRILDRIPDSTKKGVWWLKNINTYKNWISKHAK